MSSSHGLPPAPPGHPASPYPGAPAGFWITPTAQPPMCTPVATYPPTAPPAPQFPAADWRPPVMDAVSAPRGFELTPSQTVAIEYILHWFRAGASRAALITGAGGTGKTTICKEIADALGVPFGLLAPTHAARRVLEGKVGGAKFCKTIHSAVMKPQTTGADAVAWMAAYERVESGALSAEDEAALRLAMARMDVYVKFLPRDNFADGTPRLLFVDEASMIGKNAGASLMACAEASNVRLIVVGDAHQLPPVKEEGSFFFTPGVCDEVPTLTDTVRQAEGSPVLRFVQGIRLKGVIAATEGWHGDAGHVDQIICGTNKTRWRIESTKRMDLGFLGRPPQPGEPMISVYSSPAQGVFNADRFRVVETKIERRTRKRRTVDVHMMLAQFEGESVPRWFDYQLEKHEPDERFLGVRAAPIGFAYAITCHRAQGSEWDRVHVINEARFFEPDDVRWLYTACSRAKYAVRLTTKP